METQPAWKLKKWAAQICSRFLLRYGNPKYADAEAKHFARDFRTHIAPLLLGPMMDSLALRARGAYCSDRVTHLALQYVTSAIELGPLSTDVRGELVSGARVDGAPLRRRARRSIGRRAPAASPKVGGGRGRRAPCAVRRPSLHVAASRLHLPHGGGGAGDASEMASSPGCARAACRRRRVAERLGRGARQDAARRRSA